MKLKLLLLALLLPVSLLADRTNLFDSIQGNTLTYSNGNYKTMGIGTNFVNGNSFASRLVVDDTDSFSPSNGAAIFTIRNGTTQGDGQGSSLRFGFVSNSRSAFIRLAATPGSIRLVDSAMNPQMQFSLSTSGLPLGFYVGTNMPTGIMPFLQVDKAPSNTTKIASLALGSGGFITGSGGQFAGSSSGTHFGINATNGSVADFANFQNNGVSKFKIDSNGFLSSIVVTNGNISITANQPKIIMTETNTSKISGANAATRIEMYGPSFANGSIFATAYSTNSIATGALPGDMVLRAESSTRQIFANGSTIVAYFDNVPATKSLILTNSTTLNINGSSIGFIKTATAALNFPNILAAASADLTITVTGAAVNDIVMLGKPAAQDASLTVEGFVSAANTVTVRAHNVGAIAVDQPSLTYRADVLQH